MPKLPRLSGQEVIKILSQTGFQIARQKGSHIIVTKQTDSGKVACETSVLVYFFFLPFHNLSILMRVKS
ncbi:type II toxin-antitoxin system HicA family toxin [Candidatus Woesearchaeota archaeon]|nr:type II toxin-antitoxin system HicA family toxin [Candidatus Woesearchaeota archaeon]